MGADNTYGETNFNPAMSNEPIDPNAECEKCGKSYKDHYHVKVSLRPIRWKIYCTNDDTNLDEFTPLTAREPLRNERLEEIRKRTSEEVKQQIDKHFEEPAPVQEGKHTKGPWKIGNQNDGWSNINGEGWTALAKVCTRLHGKASDNEEGLANAELIAKAPETAAALQEANAKLERLRENYDQLSSAYNELGVKFDKETERWQERDANELNKRIDLEAKLEEAYREIAELKKWKDAAEALLSVLGPLPPTENVLNAKRKLESFGL